MGCLRSPYDPSLSNTVKCAFNTIWRIIRIRLMTHPCEKAKKVSVLKASYIIPMFARKCKKDSG